MTGDQARPLLRALRREPALVDDRAAADRLAPTGLTPEAVRWARAWLVCWQAALAADPRAGLDEPWEIAVRLAGVVAPKGAGDLARREEVLAALQGAGVARVEEAGGGGGRRTPRVAWLSRELFVEHAAAVGVDWPAVVEACPEPAPLLVLRALAEVAHPLDAFTSVPRRDLVARTGYQQKQVRVAVRRLAALGLIEVEGDSGTTARYRLTSRTLGRPWGATPPASTRVASPPPAPAPPRPAPMPAATVTGSDSAGVQIVLGGVAITVAPGAGFEVAPGMTARAELDPDGRPRLVLRPNDPPG